MHQVCFAAAGRTGSPVDIRHDGGGLAQHVFVNRGASANDAQRGFSILG